MMRPRAKEIPPVRGDACKPERAPFAQKGVSPMREKDACCDGWLMVDAVSDVTSDMLAQGFLVAHAQGVVVAVLGVYDAALG